MNAQELYDLGRKLGMAVGPWEEYPRAHSNAPRRRSRRTSFGSEVCSIYETIVDSNLWLANRDYLHVSREEVLPTNIEELEAFCNDRLRARGYLLVEDPQNV